jgi:N-acetylglucosamine-6-phosphate deacetylase
MKGARRLCLVTDANRALDMPPGEYLIGPRDTGERLISDGKVGRMPDGTGLASSIVGMDHMVRTMVSQTSAGVLDTVRMASLTPAERTGVDREVGSLEIGKLADVLVLSADLHVQRVFTSGVECERT